MGVDEEMRMLQLDKPGQGKTNIELQKHTIDEASYEHKPVDRSMYILSKGDELQKLSVIGSLPELLKCEQKGTVSKIIPKIQQELPNSSAEFNLAVSRMFNILIHMDIPVNLVPQILQGIENRDQMIANAWMDTLLAVIPLLKEPIIKSDILQCAVSKSQISNAPYFRVFSCKLLGKMSVHRSMNPFEVKKDILPLVQSLCQDCFHEVRAAMCQELPCVAQGLFNLGDAIVKVNLLPLLVELSADENVFVRSVAIESVVAIIPFLSADTIKNTIIPLTKKLCTRSAAEGDKTYMAIARVFSVLITNLESQMTVSDSMWFLDYYNHICKKGIAAVDEIDTDISASMMSRENCALCLPKVAMMVLTNIPTEISVKWYHTFKALAADPCYVVRKAVATYFADIVRILGPSNKIVVSDFSRLLKDDDEEVLQALIPKIAIILEIFVANNVLQRDTAVQATVDIGRGLLKCHSEAFRTNNWRMKECLLKQWERLPNCFPSDFIHQHFSHVVLKATTNARTRPVRAQATRTLLIMLRYSLKENHRKWIREMAQTQLCTSPCCYARQLYVTLCIHALDIFSWRYFKEHFYTNLLSLAEDHISIVRLSMIKLCPILKQMLVLPADRALQLKLENLLSKMEMIECDKDVLATLKAKLKEMRAFRAIKNEVLLEDKRKMEEEDRIMRGKWTGIKSFAPEYAKDPSRDFSEKPTAITVSKPGSSKIHGSAKRAADGTPSPMPFLDRHFYTDAGIALPQDFSESTYRDKEIKSPFKTSSEVTKLIESAENLTSWLNEISMKDEPGYSQDQSIELEERDMVISVENVNPAETLTESDVKALETTTTNMTDELKVNIQSVTEVTEHRTKSKRNSCIFSSEIRLYSLKSDNKTVKRRSVNIPNIESRIPVSSRSNRLSYHEKSKSASDQTLDGNTNLNKKMSKISRLTKSALNLRENETKTIERRLTGGSHETLLLKSESKLPSTENLRYTLFKASSSIDNMDEIGFKRYTASDKPFKETLKESIQNSNNIDNKNGLFALQGQRINKSSNLVSAKSLESRERNSGLPLSVRKK